MHIGELSKAARPVNNHPYRLTVSKISSSNISACALLNSVDIVPCIAGSARPVTLLYDSSPLLDLKQTRSRLCRRARKRISPSGCGPTLSVDVRSGWFMVAIAKALKPGDAAMARESVTISAFERCSQRLAFIRCIGYHDICCHLPIWWKAVAERSR